MEVRDLASGETLYTRTIRFAPGGVSFSGDGRALVASGCCDGGSTVTGWDARTGAKRFQRTVEQGAKAFAVSPVGPDAGLGAGDGSVMVLDASSGAPRSQVKVRRDICRSVLARRAAVRRVLERTGITLWDIRSGNRIGGQFPRIPGWMPGYSSDPTAI